GFLGVTLDDKRNRKNDKVISSPKSKVKVFVIPTNEALMMARKAKEILKK
ncbi:MAG: acetate kinase, partial [Nanoarchaeota archaeon]|nr:acetate kinase [Nanoarchaeota archaeon]